MERRREDNLPYPVHARSGTSNLCDIFMTPQLTSGFPLLIFNNNSFTAQLHQVRLKWKKNVNDLLDYCSYELNVSWNKVVSFFSLV